ncbi:MAG: ABC transporter substrate-binding protein, partial [Oscillospiraceae bacterium]
MKKILAAASVMILLFVLFAPAASADDEVQVDESKLDMDYYSQLSGQNITIYVYNWGEYISDGSDGSLDVNSEFERITGIKVNYTTFATNEEMYAKIKSGGAQYDVIVPSDYMIAKMINEDMLEPLDSGDIPAWSGIGDSYLGLAHDPDDEYSIPYMWGMVGIIYNTKYIEDPPDSWSALWDENYMGQILMFSNSRDAYGIALKMLGYSMNTTSLEEIDEATQALKDQHMLVQAYCMDEIFNKMEGEEAIIGPYYAGDAVTMMDENPDLAFVYPEEGTNQFVDSFVIPKGTRNKLAAEMYINFMCEPEVSAANAEYIGYFSPVEAAWDYLDMETFAAVWPSEEVLAKSEVYTALPDDVNQYIDSSWTEVLTYNENANEWIGPVFLFGALGA